MSASYEPSVAPPPRRTYGWGAGWYGDLARRAAVEDAKRLPTGDEAWGAVSRILTGMLIYGGLGWALGLWLDNPRAGAAIGIVLGVAAALYLVNHRLRLAEAAGTTRTTPGATPSSEHHADGDAR